MVNHGLISMTLFLLAGMVERRTATGELALLGGMARGRPALATVLMTVGVMALAVPLSSNFAGEFLILAGVFQQYWVWAVVGAVAIVLAAMYMLRLISAVLHREVGPAVSDAALDLRGGELAVVVPLVALLLVLSAWPAAISGRVFPAGVRRQWARLRRSTATASRASPGGAPARSSARSPAPGAGDDPQAARRLVRALALAGAARGDRVLLLMVAVFVRRGVAARRLGERLRRRLRRRVRVRRRRSTSAARTARRSSPTRSSATAGRRRRRSSSPAAASSPSLISYGERMREENIAEYYALLAAAGAGMVFFVQASNLMTLFLGLEWFSIALYVLCAIDIDLVGSLEAGLKYLVIGAVGSATLLFGSALVYGATGQLGFDRDRRAPGTRTTRCSCSGSRWCSPGSPSSPRRRRSTCGRPTSTRARPTPVTAFMASATKVAALVVSYRLLVDGVPRTTSSLWTWAIAGDRDRLARDRQHGRARPAQRQAAARLLVGLARRLHADPDRGRQRARRPRAHLLPDPLLRDVARRLRRRRGARARARARP